MQPHLAVAAAGVAVAEVDLAGADGLYFGAGENQPGLVPLQNLIVEKGAAVAGRRADAPGAAVFVVLADFSWACPSHLGELTLDN